MFGITRRGAVVAVSVAIGITAGPGAAGASANWTRDPAQPPGGQQWITAGRTLANRTSGVLVSKEPAYQADLGRYPGSRH